MRIGFFVNTYLPITYGSVTSVENFRKALEKFGHEVFVFAPRFKGYEQKNENIIEYPAILYGYRIKYPLPISYFPPIHKKAKDLKLDVIHIQQPFSIGCDGARIAKANGIPLIFTHHTRYEDYAHYVLPVIPTVLVKWYIRTRVRKLANSCDRVIAPSESIKQYIKQRGITSKIKTIPTGIDWERFRKGKREFIRRRLDIGDDKKIILSLGRIDKEKNILFLVQAIFPLLREDNSLFFVFVGDGAFVSEIRNVATQMKVERQVILTGVVKQSEIHNYYATADIFVHASQTETQGLTVTEAMASGLPIVVVEGTGVSDQIEDGKTGFLMSPNEELFRKKVKMLLDDQEKGKQIGDHAKEIAKNMDFMNQAKKLEQVYLEEISDYMSKKRGN